MSRPASLAAFTGLGLLAAAVVGAAAEPAPAPRPLPGVAALAPASRPAGPRAAAFLTRLYPDARPIRPRLPAATAPESPLPAGYEVVVLAQHRPIRVRVTIQIDGKPVGELWQAALRKAFDHFDRDGDGYLNGYEVQNVFSPTAMASLLQTGFPTPTPLDLPSLDRLDADGDRRVSFAEFAAFYKATAAQVSASLR